jgi:methionyl aminopeptidase
MIETKSRSQLETMDRVNRVVRTILSELAARVRPGISTGELGAHAERRLSELGAKPAFKGYPHPEGGPAFPAVLCTSINDEIVHGIPDPGRHVKEGDILSLDFGACIDGLFGDAALTVPVGRIEPVAQKLIDVTRDALMRGIEQVRPGNRVLDIAAAVQGHAESNGFSVVRSFVGHGIGRRLHEDPPVPNFVDRGPNPRLTPGMVLAIEPMITVGSYDVEMGTTADWRTRPTGSSAISSCPWPYGKARGSGRAPPRRAGRCRRKKRSRSRRMSRPRLTRCSASSSTTSTACSPIFPAR